MWVIKLAFPGLAVRPSEVGNCGLFINPGLKILKGELRAGLNPLGVKIAPELFLEPSTREFANAAPHGPEAVDPEPPDAGLHDPEPPLPEPPNAEPHGPEPVDPEPPNAEPQDPEPTDPEPPTPMSP